jgi:hypothetical protein
MKPTRVTYARKKKILLPAFERWATLLCHSLERYCMAQRYWAAKIAK